MNKRAKILLGSLCAVAMLIGGMIAWQWQNIKAVTQAIQYSNEELAVKIDEQKTAIETILKDYGLEDVMDFTLEEEEAIRKGEISFEEAMEKLEQRRQEVLVGKSTEQVGNAENVILGNEVLNSNDGKGGTTGSKGEGSQNTTSGSTTSTQTAVSTKEVTEKAVNQMYALKAKYIGELGQLERAARNEYSSLSAEQKKTTGMRSVASKYMNPALSLQSQCDAEVAIVIGTLKSYLQANKESTEIIPVMKAAYEREKELKKAYYISLLS